MNTCNGCRWWSEMIAHATAGAPLEAMCLNPVSPCTGRFTKERDTCAHYGTNHLGAVDEPGQDPDRYGSR